MRWCRVRIGGCAINRIWPWDLAIGSRRISTWGWVGPEGQSLGAEVQMWAWGMHGASLGAGERERARGTAIGIRDAGTMASLKGQERDGWALLNRGIMIDDLASR